MICQVCGVEAPTRKATFIQHIGMIVLMFNSHISGHMCKSCVHRNFWKNFTVTALFGWWGLISMFLTPFVLLINLVGYLICLPMPGVPPGARAPVLTEEAASRMFPYVDELFLQLNAGEDFTTLATRIAQQAGVTPGQVALFAQSLIQSSEEQPAPAQ